MPTWHTHSTIIIDRKQRKVADEYVRLCGYGRGGDRKSECHNGALKKLTLLEISKQLGTSERNLQRALSIERNLTEDMKDCLDKGVFSKTVAEQTDTLKQGRCFFNT